MSACQFSAFRCEGVYDQVRQNRLLLNREATLTVRELDGLQIHSGTGIWNAPNWMRHEDTRLFSHTEYGHCNATPFTARNKTIARRTVGPPDFRVSRSTTSLGTEPLELRHRMCTRHRMRQRQEYESNRAWPTQEQNHESCRSVEFPPAKSNFVHCKSCQFPGVTEELRNVKSFYHEPCPPPPPNMIPKEVGLEGAMLLF
ncbi:unnamed protein product [Amoebophrya sp. A25]|nr:unnamed protein product [Amoebophrya sp. A25]|eukprot:GSA25T00005935001.1